MTATSRHRRDVALFVIAMLAAAPVDAGPNLLTIDDFGTDNRLRIDQQEAGGNRIAVSLSGEGHGGWGADWTRPLEAAMPPLLPGRLTQTGTGHDIALGVLGSDNLFTIVQTGGAHSARGSIQGTGNMAAVHQAGSGHVAVFRQHGARNTVAISQSSW